MKKWLRNIGSETKVFAVKIWISIKKCTLKYIWPIFKHVWNKANNCWDSTKLRHKVFAMITFSVIGVSIQSYGLIDQNTWLIILFFLYSWVMTYIVKSLNSNPSVSIIFSRIVAIAIFMLTIIISFLLIPIIFDLLYFKGHFFIENGAITTLLMILLIFISPSLLILGARGLGASIRPEFNFRKYVIILMTILTIGKIVNDFNLSYGRAYNSYMCLQTGDTQYCSYHAESYITFEDDSTLWIMNEVIYQSMIIIFLLENVIPRIKRIQSEKDIMNDIDRDIMQTQHLVDTIILNDMIEFFSAEFIDNLSENRSKLEKYKKCIYYFYGEDKELFYIGMIGEKDSTNIYARIVQHANRHKDKHWYSRSKQLRIITFDNSQGVTNVDKALKYIERVMIKSLNPKYNDLDTLLNYSKEAVLLLKNNI